MKTINFEVNSTEDEDHIMDIGGLNPVQIRVNHKSRQISIVCNDKSPGVFLHPLTQEELEDKNWTKIKKFVEDNGGTYLTKKIGIEYLLNL